MKTYLYNNLTGNAIDENGNEFTLQGKFALVCGPGVMIFDTYDDREEYILSRIPTWDKDTYSEQLNAAHKSLFRKYYYDDLPQDERYESIGEITLWLNDVDYGGEATKLKVWWINTCKQIINYLGTVTEETAIPIENYLNSLPNPFED